METHDRSNKSDRRGIVLILALGMLTMFTVVAITLAAIAKSEATAASNFKRVEQFGTLKLDVAPEEIDDLFRVAMNQLIYDTRNTSSAIRGHSLLRDMYGSPDKYAFKLGQTYPTFENSGADLRFREIDRAKLQVVLGQDFDYSYQGVYNGTGLFLPKKMDLSALLSGGIPARNLTNAEIALQTAFLTVPSSFGSHVATQLPAQPAAWQALFRPGALYDPQTIALIKAANISNIRFLYPRFPLNYQVFDQFTPNGLQGTERPATPNYPDGTTISPELFYVQNINPSPPYSETMAPTAAKHWFGFDEDYDYPDVNNMFLAMERADGTILIPSFHRPGLVSQVGRGVYQLATNSSLANKAELDFAHALPWLSAATPIPTANPPIPQIGDALRGLVLRPRSADYDIEIMTRIPGQPLPLVKGKAGRFKELSDVTGDGIPDDLDGSGAIGDSPMELDVDTDGDGKKDAIWVDLGAPVMSVGNTSFKPMYAFKVIDLDSKINLNVHGNLVRTPQSGGGTVGYPLQHTSHLGASPTEINPMHAMILGDIPNDPNLPPKPRWSVGDGTGATADSTPYKRMLTGEQRITPAAPGRWTPPGESLVSSDDGPGRSVPGDLAASDDNQNRAFDHSEGNGTLIDPTAPGNGAIPAVMGRYGLIDPIGVGRTYPPFSKTATDNASTFGLTPQEPNFLPGLLNHVETTSGTYGARMDGLRDGSNGHSLAQGGLSIDFFGTDEAYEFNAHASNNSADSPINAAELARLIRDNDIDISVQNNRLSLLNPGQWQSRQADVTSAAGATPGYLSREVYSQRRMRRMFTHASWDLIRYNAPPTTSFPFLAGPALPNESSGGLARLIADPTVFAVIQDLNINPQTAGLADLIFAIAQKRNGSIGMSKSLTSILKSLPDISLPSQLTDYFTALDTFRQKRTADGVGYVLPTEVQNGQRFDLNRPLTQYTPNSSDIDKIDLERESFAQQIYVLLYLSSGAMGPEPNNSSFKIAPLRLRLGQARVLAQLAVNIVDYIDPDNVMTIMRFDPDLSNGWNLEPGQLADSGTLNGLVNGSNNPNADPDGNLGAAQTNNVVAQSVMTVIGFELPELVINEALTIVAEDVRPDPNDPQDLTKAQRFEHVWHWAELFCPWPNYVDPLDNQPGLALRTDRGGPDRPVYMIGVHDHNEKQSLTANMPATGEQLSDEGYSDPGVPNRVRRFVQFKKGDPLDNYAKPTANLNQPVRVPPRIDGESGYLLVGPEGTTKVQRTGGSPLSLLRDAVWIAPTGEGEAEQGTNDYTARAFYSVRQVPILDAKSPNSELKLYRLRNPYAIHDPIRNPYIVTDYVRLGAKKRALSGTYRERKASDNTLEMNVRVPGEVEAGAYYVQDTEEANQPPTGVTPTQSETQRYSLQRKQPWHGFNSEWTPYGRDPAHPLYGTYLGNQGTGEMYYEGLFLGLPSLADNGLIDANDPLKRHDDDDLNTVESTTTTGPEHQENAMEQSGFAPAIGVPDKEVTFKQGTRKNAGAFGTWLSFPFINRQLATPLELTSVRLYGSHAWFLPATYSPSDTTQNFVDVTDSSAVLEWRQRFTDDFEFAVHAWRPSPGTSDISGEKFMYERLWRDRHVPWYADNRLSGPNWGWQDSANLLPAIGSLLPPNAETLGAGLRAHSGPQFVAPFPHLYRFFEFVECRSRMKNSRDLVAERAWTQRDDRTPGKINLNTLTEEEVYKGLVDSISAMYMGPGVFGSMLAGNLKLDDFIDYPYWPTLYATPDSNYPLEPGLTSALGEFPLINGNVSVRDITSKAVPWMSLGLSQTASNTVTWGTVPGQATANVLLLNSGFELYAAELWPGFAGALLNYATNPTGDPLQDLSLLLASLNAQPADVVPSPLTQSGFTPHPLYLGYLQSPNVQWPGIIKGPEAATPGVYPGTDPNSQVSSEMYRMLLLSRAGADGVVGTGDDKPFRSYASDDVSDTILRPRNFKSLDFVHGGSIDLAVFTGPSPVSDLADLRLGGAVDFLAATLFDGTDDILNLSGANIGVGDYIVRLGGQFTPRLFDPIPDPYTEDVRLILNYAAAPDALGPRIPNLTNDANDAEALDYWMLESRRNEIQAKISNNVTTRSHVFAVWVTVGLFRVEPGTEDLRIPLLGAEVGSEKGQPVRHRAFFIVDRSKAKAYDPEDIDANYELPQIQSKGIIEYYKILE